MALKKSHDLSQKKQTKKYKVVIEVPVFVGKIIQMKTRETHPWITFKLRLPLDDYRLWLQLGEASSKVDHLAGVPLKPSFAEELHRIFLAKGVMATTAIEGNTLSEEQVLQHIEGDLELPPSQEYLEQEIDNILRVCNREIKEQLGNQPDARPILCTDLIKNYNKEILHNLKVEEGVIPGRYRLNSVIVGNVYRGAPAEDCERLMDQLCTWLNGSDFDPPAPSLKTPFALVKAMMAHLYLAWIHPFGDGNGRTARLLEFHILFSAGIPLPAAHLLSDHYNKTRADYYRELDKASKSGGDVVPFIRYAVRGFVDGIRAQIGRIREQQFEVAWENYVYEAFRREKSSVTHKRRRELVLTLGKMDWVKTSQIELLTPTLARDYANSGERMVTRDLNALAKMGLLVRKRGQVKANADRIRAFLPGRVTGQ